MREAFEPVPVPDPAMTPPVKAPRTSAIILTGGASRRMGEDKASLRLGGRTLLDRVLDALTASPESPIDPIVVVGPATAITDPPRNLIAVTEAHPRGGPAHALATGLAHIPGGSTIPGDAGDEADNGDGNGDDGVVLVLAADLPFFSPESAAALIGRLGGKADMSHSEPGSVGHVDGAVYTDGGRPQWLCGAWRVESLREVIAVTGAPEGTSLRAILGGLDRDELTWTAPGPPPYFDCDTPEAFAEAKRLLSTREE